MSKTPAELEKAYLKGGKMKPMVRTGIERQLKRTCMYKECDNSLAFERADKTYCSDSHKRRAERSRLKTNNRQKKRRYNERHGIVRKTIKRKIVNDSGLDPKGYDIIYENYKEPLKEVPKGKGFGYYGTIATTSDKEYVQCHICGKLYGHLGIHVRNHKTTARAYKEAFGLAASTALISDSVRRNLQVHAVKPGNKTLPAHLVEYNRKVQSGEIKHKAHGKSIWSLEKRNKEGNCPEQLLEKIKDLAEELGHPPSSDEFRAKYGGRFLASISYLHGTYATAVKKAVGMSKDELRHPDNERLLMDLIEFQERHGRIPMTSDFNRGLLRDKGVYIRQFGTLNNARIEAGLNAVLPMPFGQVVELTPDEYREYKKGREVPGKISETAIKKRKYRARRRLATAI